MTQPGRKYRIVTRVHINQWNEPLQSVIPGWDIRALWYPTGTILPVFVPDTNYSPEVADSLIKQAGEKDDAIHALGA